MKKLHTMANTAESYGWEFKCTYINSKKTRQDTYRKTKPSC